ncbi:hypothetical protein L1N82_20575 [Paenibacillus tarimensis]|nr:hypothetical protein [Paenibacillus tarimensis]
MDFYWVSAIYPLILLSLVILFFVGLYKFVNRLIQHTKETQAALKRIEDKVDQLTEELRRK